MQQTQRIIQLTAENFKRLKAVTIRPDGSLVVVGGANGQGKSSVLDSIMAAIAGKGNICEMPIRTGKAQASVEVTLDDFIVTRKFTAAGGSTLKVTTREGSPLKAPQEILDGLLGKLSFDPLDFARMADKKPREAVDLLKKVVGLDFTEVDGRRARHYESRTNAGRELERVRGELSGYLEDKTAPAEEVKTADLLAKLTGAQEKNRQNAEVRNSRGTIVSVMGFAQADIVKNRKRIDELKAEIVALEKAGAELLETNKLRDKTLAELDIKIAGLVDDNEDAIRTEIASSEGINARVRNAKKRNELLASVAAQEKSYNELTSAIDKCDAEKTTALKNAKFPIPEISFDETGVLLGGVPFAQGSTAERLRASLALGAALSPKLRVILVKEGNDLDKNSLALVQAFAEANDQQIWLEKISSPEEASVWIDDGNVVEPEPAASPAPVTA